MLLPTGMSKPPNEESTMRSNTATYPGAGHFRRTTSLLLGLPFDLAREHYAQAVRWGLLKNSMLASARFARELARAERQALGPWARQV
jgi:hypothetical protein